MDASTCASEWKKRFRKAREDREARRLEGLAAAGAAAHRLREVYGARRVLVFGSAVRPGHFSLDSDLDLAVAGLTSRQALEAELACSEASGYTRSKRMWERIAREMEGGVPTGPAGHRDLLESMALDLPGVRPAVLSGATLQALVPYLGLRHCIRKHVRPPARVEPPRRPRPRAPGRRPQPSPGRGALLRLARADRRRSPLMRTHGNAPETRMLA